MKLLRVGASGAEIPGLLAPDGTIRDLSAHVHDINGDALSPAGLLKLEAVKWTSCPAVNGSRASARASPARSTSSASG